MLKKCGYTLLLFLFNLQFLHSGEPTAADWQLLKKAVGGRLIEVSSPVEKCTKENCAEIWKLLENAFVIQEHPWGTQSTGWFDAWTSSVSPHVVAAESTQDIVAAVNFAREHHLKLVIKGAGHDYLGRSNAPDSLLIWTHNMRDVTTDDYFIPKGAPSSTAGLHAVTLQAGARWIEVYDAVTTKNHRYVQGGGCTTVGAAGGFLQGGGFGSFSKKYGTGAGSLLEAEIVIANGDVLIANEYQNTDLFWALKGGGGGTFGVVSKVTLQTHDLPNYFGFIQGKVKANSEDAYKKLIEHFIHFYRKNLFNENWGEQAVVRPDNSLDLLFLFLGMTEEEAKSVWKPFRNWIEEKPGQYTIETSYTVFPAYKFWDLEYWKEKDLDFVKPFKNNLYYWTVNQGEVSAFWYAYHSRWLPSSLFEKTNTKKLTEILFNASRHWQIALHFNKGLAGASEKAIVRTKNSSINPVVLKSPALMIIGARTEKIFPGMPGHEPDREKASNIIKKINAAVKIITDATPNSGAYSSEADYFQKDWQLAFWGENYPKLLKIKLKYDPENLFNTHHSVGSEKP